MKLHKQLLVSDAPKPKEKNVQSNLKPGGDNRKSTFMFECEKIRYHDENSQASTKKPFIFSQGISV